MLSNPHLLKKILAQKRYSVNVALFSSQEFAYTALQIFNASLSRRYAGFPSEVLTLFVQDGVFTAETLTRFAKRLGIEVGILVGRLQHD